MTLSRINHLGAAPTTGLASSVTADDTSLTLASGTGYPTSNFVIKVDAGTAAEEKILVGSRSGTACSSLTRGYDGTTATSHSSGTANVEHDLAAVVIDDANDHIYTTTRDDHTQYARTDGSRTFTGGITVDGDSTITGDLTVSGTLTVGSGTVAGRMYGTGATTTLSGSPTKLPLTQDFVQGSVTASSNQLTVPVSGLYLVTAAAYFTGTGSQSATLLIYKNGSVAREVSGSNAVNPFADIFSCSANDYFAMYAEGSNASVSGGTLLTWLSVVKVG